MKALREFDPDIWSAIEAEKKRQMEGLELIPSENFVSVAVLEALGSVMTNKYSEGLPGKRYYGGNQFIDIAEQLAIDRAKQLFGCEHVNVQPYSGSSANLEALHVLLKLGEPFMGMALAHGGHLTHGAAVSFSGQFYKSIPYGVDEKTEMIDYNEIRRIALRERPKVILSGHSAYPRELDFKQFREIADEVGAYHMADIAHIAGLVAAGIHQSPIPYCEIVTTTTHKTLRGPRSAIIMCKKEFAEKVDKAVFPTFQGGPHDHVNAAKAVAFKEALQPEFKDYARQIVRNAKALADTLLSFGFRLVTGGTDNHLMLVDLRNKNVTGKEAEAVLDEVGICVNKNMIPFDPRKPWDPSGIRLGTPAVTTRGMRESEMKAVGELISKAIEFRADSTAKERIRADVRALCARFVFYK
ncbi:MAG: serine hydroxymethyltransferase [Candidatus Aenigmatarchaeota archaeon]